MPLYRLTRQVGALPAGTVITIKTDATTPQEPNAGALGDGQFGITPFGGN